MQHTITEILDAMADGVRIFNTRLAEHGTRDAAQAALALFEAKPDSFKLAFDLFLVRMGDLLAREPGQPGERFVARVWATATGLRASDCMRFVRANREEQ